MTQSQQSFSLPSADKQRLQLAADGQFDASSKGDRETRAPKGTQGFAVPASRPNTAGLSEGDGQSLDIGSILIQPYSQSIDQTQEDTPSFKQQVDNAPVMQRPQTFQEDYFEASASGLEGLVPRDASTAKARDTVPASFSPPSSFRRPTSPSIDSQVPVRFEESPVTKIDAETPALARTKKHETPSGLGNLTQMFQASQDTPELSRRKSTYISMKESQELRNLKRHASASEDEDSDPEFQKVRRAKSPAKKSQPSDPLWGRLRERQAQSLIPETYQDISVIPASAPLEDRIDPAHRSQPVSLVDNSQVGVNTQASSKAAAKTIDFDIQSFSAEVTTSEEPRPPAQEFDLVSQSPQQDTTMLNATGSALASVSVQDTPAIPRIAPTPGVTRHNRSIAETPFVRDGSSPVILAGNRRKRRKTAEITASSSPAPILVDERQVLESLSQTFDKVLSPEHSRQVPDSVAQTSTDVLVPIKTAPRRPQDSRMVVLDSQTQPKPTPETVREASLSVSPEQRTSPLTSLDSAEMMDHMPVAQEDVHHDPALSHRVLAYHAPSKSWFPGSVVGDVAKDAESVHVLFDDDDELEVPIESLRALRLFCGDIVRVSHPAALRKTSLVVTDLIKLDHVTKTDDQGFAQFRAHKQSRKFESYVLNVSSLWLRVGKLVEPFLGRPWKLPVDALVPSSAVPAPSPIPITPSRRDVLARTVRSTSRLPTPMPALRTQGSSGIFNGIAFTLTLVKSTEKLRRALRQLIVDHGGIFLEDGLSELFDEGESLKPQPSIYNEDSLEEQSDADEITSDCLGSADGRVSFGTLRLAPRYASLRAACVISDAPSRKAKYLQALALDLPCFHYAYIQHCAAASQQSSRMHSARPYLLAAGDAVLDKRPFSICMDPIIKSLSLQNDSATLASLLEQRRQPLAGQHCIVVVGRRDEAVQRKIHLFLSRAMGCARVAAVETIADAVDLFMQSRRAELIKEPWKGIKGSKGRRASQRVGRPTSKYGASTLASAQSVHEGDDETIAEQIIWHWINVREHSKEVEEAMRQLSGELARGRPAHAKAKPRRRGHGVVATQKADTVDMPGILTNEDVVQSLICGEIMLTAQT
ncbi:hypothetical protein BCR37DRAFT_381828 [Protomyces lactucae-debilis]|uniref:BRCT domain-containing protein n=1 Tax=Protomyces lactucae-debilis TaxID=2754530 RepID=A0A1Y2F659_PROLT|nr:uncharacterized protein BCR37DRAFT_381828 [Protomyces lactucae-debilis]ORY78964.1 hypothetical protein BCR37DRAFT_381828 [Protomyces lactucae-debilis]